MKSKILVRWPDGHESNFKPEFFMKYGPSGTSPDFKGFSSENDSKQLWYGNHKIGRHDFNAIKEEDNALFNYLKGETNDGKIQDFFIFSPDLFRNARVWNNFSGKCTN